MFLNICLEQAVILKRKIERSYDKVQRFASILADFDYISSVGQNIAEGFNQLSNTGVTLDSQMHDLSAVTGVTGEGLKQIETFARRSTKAFCTDAAVVGMGLRSKMDHHSE